MGLANCSKCGQALSERVAAAAADGAYCWQCGGRRSAEGRCQSPRCAWFGEVPGPVSQAAKDCGCERCGLLLPRPPLKTAEAVAMCCECDTVLAADGTCQNPLDKANFRRIPDCS